MKVPLTIGMTVLGANIILSSALIELLFSMAIVCHLYCE